LHELLATLKLQSARACAGNIRNLIIEFSKIVKSLCRNPIDEATRIQLSTSGHTLKQELMLLDYASGICHMVDLFATASIAEQIQSVFGMERCSMLFSCCADVLHGIGATVSVLSFIKPDVVGSCTIVCNLALCRSRQEELDGLNLSEAKQQLAEFMSNLEPTQDRYPCAACVFLLASYLDLDSNRNNIIDQINLAVASVLIFLCSRVSYVLSIRQKKAGTKIALLVHFRTMPSLANLAMQRTIHRLQADFFILQAMQIKSVNVTLLILQDPKVQKCFHLYYPVIVRTNQVSWKMKKEEKRKKFAAF
jgi:hypothetical protein